MQRVTTDKGLGYTEPGSPIASSFRDKGCTSATNSVRCLRRNRKLLRKYKLHQNRDDNSEITQPLLGMASTDIAKSHDGTTTTSNLDDESFNVDNAAARRVLRKIDLRVIPLLFITYNLNFMDKTILSSASVFGLSSDTGLKGQEYSWVSSIFYFGYFFWEYPTTFLIQRLRVGQYVGVNTVLWGVVVAVTAACTDYGGLLIVRFLLGVAEATTSPAFVFITSTWYTRSEIPFRTGIWFAGNSLGGVFSSFIAYGLGHVEHPLHPWQWMFIVLGVATFLWGVVLFFFLPNSIASASFLTPEERGIAQQRVHASGTGTEKHAFASAEAIEAILDPKTWFIFSMSLLTQIPNSGTQNFGNLVLKGFGFSSLDSTLVVLPASFISFASITGAGWLAGKYSNITTHLVCIVVIFPIVGSAIIYTGAGRGVKLFAYYLLSAGSTALPLLLSLVGSNLKGSTKKMTVTAILFLAYCAGNVIGPQLFKMDEAPHYNTAFEAIMICYALVVFLAMGLRFYLITVNKRRSKEEASIHGHEELAQDDATDSTAKGFRYRC
ncbi:hypothetical protein EG328_006712 [Venturia inaequalis]|uniref:Major facilitator superfamily (MFS) profile domain-containing protein n=1 Tax=Venturia inaequalis TaxID=5025 RepID=A0A8H3UHP8_VENIN|nr:hypothetical protein EG328_006712 [Venturia inaequalis]